MLEALSDAPAVRARFPVDLRGRQIAEIFSRRFNNRFEVFDKLGRFLFHIKKFALSPRKIPVAPFDERLDTFARVFGFK